MTLKEYTLKQLHGYDEKIAQPEFLISAREKTDEETGEVIGKEILQGKNADGSEHVVLFIPDEQIEMENIDFDKDW